MTRSEGESLTLIDANERVNQERQRRMWEALAAYRYRYCSIPPAEAPELMRRQLMGTLPIEKQNTLRTFDEERVRAVIEKVSAARRVNQDISDWDIHIDYRRAIAVHEPDPLIVQEAQISGLLLEGPRKEARYPF